MYTPIILRETLIKSAFSSILQQTEQLSGKLRVELHDFGGDTLYMWITFPVWGALYPRMGITDSRQPPEDATIQRLMLAQIA